MRGVNEEAIETAGPEDVDYRLFGRPLRDPRHEQYCQLRALEGKTAREAYTLAVRVATNRTTAARNAPSLESRPEIRDRIEQLQHGMIRMRAARTLVTQSYLVEALIEIVDRCMAHSQVIVRGDKQTVVHKDEVTGEDQLVGLFAFDPANATKAVVALAKMHGWDSKPEGELPTAPGSLDEVEKRLNDKIEELKRLREQQGAMTKLAAERRGEAV